MNTKILALVTFFVTAMTFAVSQPAGDRVVTLADVGFFAGHWVAADEAGAYEEIWFAPREGVMSGMFRWPDAGGSGRYVLELLTMVERDDGVTFYFKHFDPNVEAWEKAEANTYDVVSVADGCARLELVNENAKVPQVMRYCRFADGTLEFRGGDGKSPIEQAEFRLKFKRGGTDR